MWEPTLPGANEARTDTIIQALHDNIADLNTTLGRDDLWVYEAETSHIVKGDVDVLPDFQTAPLLICVEGAEYDDVLEMKTMEPSHMIGWQHLFYTNIFVYPHPDALPNAEFVSKRETVIERCIDWIINGIFNNWTNKTLEMTSRDYNAAPDFDQLVGGIVRVYKDWFDKSDGGTQRLRGAKLIHEGRVG